MSVVNEMLKELQRDQGKTPTFDGFVVAPPENTVSKVFWRSVAVLILLLISFIIYKEYQPVIAQQNNIPLAAEASALQSQNSTLPESRTDVVFANESPDLASEQQTQAIEKQVVSLSQNETKVISAPVADTVEHSNNETLQIDKPTKKTIPTKVAKLESPVTKPMTNRIASTEKLPIKTRSQKNIEEQKLAKLMKHWNTQSVSTNTALALELERSSKRNDIRLKLLRYIQPRSPNLFDQILSRSLAKQPNNLGLRTLSARDFFSKGNFNQAILELGQVANIEWDKSTYRLAALIEQKRTNHKMAIQYFGRLQSIEPKRGDISMAMGISYEALLETQLAIRKFKRALQDNQLSEIQKQFIQQRLVALQG
jgi:Tfp pilus assembly protein PilF